jgi:transaldolase
MTTSSRVRRLHEVGVSVWLDDLSRPLLEDGVLDRYIAEHALSGVTSNPSIFAAALRASDRYAPSLAALAARGVADPRARFFALALQDVADAADRLRATYDRSDGRDGYVSFECTPDVASDARATVAQAADVWARVGRPNLMIKVPGTRAGISAIEALTARGVNVNVTLLFTRRRHAQAARAYQRGLARRAARGAPVARVRSVASVFVSRIDARVSDLAGGLPGGASVAIANARAIHRQALQLFDGPAWQALRDVGARWQRPLWASTAPKDPAMRDVAYVEALALPGTIVTVPERTLAAFADHGIPRPAATGTRAGPGEDGRTWADVLDEVARRGVDLDAVGADLEADGVRAFADAYGEVLGRLADRAASAAPAAATR